MRRVLLQHCHRPHCFGYSVTTGRFPQPKLAPGSTFALGGASSRAADIVSGGKSGRASRTLGRRPHSPRQRERLEGGIADHRCTLANFASRQRSKAPTSGRLAEARWGEGESQPALALQTPPERLDALASHPPQKARAHPPHRRSPSSFRSFKLSKMISIWLQGSEFLPRQPTQGGGGVFGTQPKQN